MAQTLLQRKAQKHIVNESRWLQKVLFGLDKARQARQKLAEIRGEELSPVTIETSEGPVTLSALEEAIRLRSDTLLETLEKRRSGLLLGLKGSKA
ncbi:MAG: hypothetical protein HKO65_16580 [Gemmatimonadetes bacterium]|nr:hypothetical protein [Gemmatimonadota bacterium]